MATNIGHDDYMKDKRAKEAASAPPLPGITLRDFFAVNAMPFELTESSDYNTVAQRCFSMADAMLEARTK